MVRNAKNKVPPKEVSIVSLILPVTSLFCMVSKKLSGDVERTRPVKGATKNNNSNPLKKTNIICNGFILLTFIGK